MERNLAAYQICPEMLEDFLRGKFYHVQLTGLPETAKFERVDVEWWTGDVVVIFSDPSFDRVPPGCIPPTRLLSIFRDGKPLGHADDCECPKCV